MSSVTNPDCAMDTPRVGVARQRRIRRAVSVACGIVILLAVGLALVRLTSAAPAVERSTLWIGTVQRGRMSREVRGLGLLVPETVRWNVATTSGRVEAVLVQPGAQVRADTLLFELSNSEVEAVNLEAQLQLRAAEGRLVELRARLETERLDGETALAALEAQSRQARIKADADGELAKQKLIADLTLRFSNVAAEELENRVQLQRARLRASAESARAQVAIQQAEVDQRRAVATFRRTQYEALHVRAGIAGVLEQVLVEVGSDIAAGGKLARVVQPQPLKAVIKIAEAEARDLRVGQPARITTHHSEVPAHVSRLDPAVHGGTVTVDLAIDDVLPDGARPDLSVEATIELDRLDDVVFISRPVSARTTERAVTTLFRLDASGRQAARANVKFGRASATTIEIVEGLTPGDKVILSDCTPWESDERIRLR